MRKILITGSVASGKTTLARTISEEYGIPHYELDCIVHVKTENGRYKRTPDEQIAEIQRIDGESGWIMEGVFRESYRCVFELADMVVFLDTPYHVRFYRILKRFIKQQLRIESCEYKSDLKMLKMMFKWLNGFEKERENFMSELNHYEYKLITIKKGTD